MPIFNYVQRLIPLCLLLALVACDDAATAKAGYAPPPPAVGVVELQPETVTLYDQLPGRLEASRVAQVRAQVSGIVQQRLFTEGSTVKAGQSLFKIDDLPYRARHEANIAQLERAKAVLAEAEYQAKRYEKLSKDQAVSELELIRVQAIHKQAQANIEVVKADLRNSQVSLNYSKVSAPIGGRIGRSLVTEGALVSATEATPMALVQQIDPMYINLQQSSQLLLQRYLDRQAQENSGERGSSLIGGNNYEVTLMLGDKPYEHKGKLLFHDISVNEGTGQLMLRAEIPNPDGLLLPGMYVQARIPQPTYNNAYLVPQQAVMRSEAGDVVQIIDADDTVVSRPVTVVSNSDQQWLITAGLEPGERLMVDGFQKSRVGAKVTPVPWKNALLLDVEQDDKDTAAVGEH